MTEPRSTGPDGDSLGDEHPGLRSPDPAADALPSTDGSDALESPDRPERTAPAGGPPAGGVFSLERPASGLYLVAWLLTGIGLATLIIAVISTAGARSQLAMAGLLSMSVGLAAACGSQVVERRVSRPEAAYRGPSPVLGFFTAAVLSGSAAVVLGIAGLLDPAAGSGFLLGLLVVAAGYFAVVVFFVVRTGALTWVQMGWPAAPGRVSRLVSDAGFGLIVTVPVLVPVLLGAGILAAILDVQPTGRIPPVEGVTATILVVLGAAVVAPIAEEVFFRGFALSAWQRDLGARPALIRSAVFFALVHIANVGGATFGDAAREAILQVSVILPLGFILGWAYQRHGIGASIAGHIGYNGTLLVLAAAAGQLGGGAPA